MGKKRPYTRSWAIKDLPAKVNLCLPEISSTWLSSMAKRLRGKTSTEPGDRIYPNHILIYILELLRVSDENFEGLATIEDLKESLKRGDQLTLTRGEKKE